MRGIFLRRRFRRRLEEALAAGAVLTNEDGSTGFGGRSHRRKVQRPTLYDLSVLPPYFSTSSPHDGNWEKLMVSFFSDPPPSCVGMLYVRVAY